MNSETLGSRKDLLPGSYIPAASPGGNKTVELQQIRQDFNVDLKSWEEIITEANWLQETKIISKICFTRKPLMQDSICDKARF